MSKKILIDASHAEETRVVVLDGNRLEDFDVETATRKQIKGNIYLAKVIRVEPSLQAAFVEYGGNRHGFLAFGEIHPDYYQIPVADRQRLLALQAEAAEEEGEAEADDAGTAAPEPAVAGDSETDPHSGTAQALAITAIDIISAPPPDADAEEVGPGAHPPEAAEPATAEAVEAELAGHPESVPEAASPTSSAEFNWSEPGSAEASESFMPEEGETAGAADDDLETNGEYLPPQPPPESLGGDGDDAAEAQERRQRQRFLRHYKIQEVIHRRQIMLIQVVKEERGNKGAALTTYLSLAGRFSVLMPNSPTGGGVSRKITSAADRRRLKEAVAELDVPAGMGLIVRTAGANRPKPEIKRDCEYLLRLWDDIRERTLQSIAPALIYEEASLIKRTIRDVYTRDVDDIHVDGEEGFRAAQDFMRMLMPSHARKVQAWTEGQPLFARYQVEAQLDAMLNPIVQLRSGGYIVINQTEALVAIDVNSGRSTRERSIEDTAVRTNMEAAEEAARQLRMRDLAGLIVIDFIDMESRKNNAMVERKLKDALKNDRARIQVGSISHFGLMEMSRQRLRPSLAEAALVPCPHCAGIGHVRSPESAALYILRAVEDEGAKFRAAEIVVTLPPDIALYLFNHKRDRLSAIETRYGMRVIFTGDASLTAANFRIEKTRAQSGPPPAALPPAPQISRTRLPESPAAEPPPAAAPVAPISIDLDADEENEPADAAPAGETADEGERRRRRRRRRRGRRAEPGAAPPQPDPARPAAENGEAVLESSDPESAEPTAPWHDPHTEMDRILAAELGDPSDIDQAAEGSEPELGALGPQDGATAQAEPLEPGEKPRRRRSTSGRRRSRAVDPPADDTNADASHSDESLPVEWNADLPEAVYSDILKPAEWAREAIHVENALVAAPEPDGELEPSVEPPRNAPAPLIRPIVIDAAEAPVEKKRGWWRR